MEVDKQLKFKSHQRMQVEFISNNVDVMTHDCLSSVALALHTSPPQSRTRSEHRRFNIQKNVPLSDTKLTLDHRVGFISSHLTMDKLFPVNPRAITCPRKMSLLLEAKSMPVWGGVFLFSVLFIYDSHF